jgi:hypothetical protein
MPSAPPRTEIRIITPRVGIRSEPWIARGSATPEAAKVFGRLRTKSSLA